MLGKVLDKAIETIADPVLIILFLVIVGLFLMLYNKDRCLQTMSKEHHDEIDKFSLSIVKEIQLVAKSLDRQITLLEFLIYNKGSNK